MTDHGNLYGAIEFYRECKARGHQPDHRLRGLRRPRQAHRPRGQAPRRGRLPPHAAGQERHRLQEPHQDVVDRLPRRLSTTSRASTRSCSKPTARASSACRGCASSEFSEFILKDQLDEAERAGRVVRQALRQELLRRDPEQRPRHPEALRRGGHRHRQPARPAAGGDLRRPLPAAQDDAVAHDVLLCINTGTAAQRREPHAATAATSSTSARPRRCTSSSPATRTRSRAARRSPTASTSSSTSRSGTSPSSRRRPSKTPEDYLRELCEQGLHERYGEQPAARPRATGSSTSSASSAGWASPATSSSSGTSSASPARRASPPAPAARRAGRIVSYVLKLSHVGPLEYDLLFERFLDPNRTEAPDIDIDFCQDRREEVIALRQAEVRRGERGPDRHLRHAGGQGRDQGRRPRARRAARPRQPARPTLVPEGAQHHARRVARAEPRPEAGVRQRPGGPRADRHRPQAGRAPTATPARTPPASSSPTGRSPTTCRVQRVIRKGDDGGDAAARPSITTQWVMGDLEKVGLLKMDFLGLRTLTLLDNAVKLIEKTRGEKHRPVQAAARRPGDLRPAPARRRQGRVPARIRRHPRAAQADEARQHPRPHRHQRPLPPRPARRRHGRRLRQPQARPREADVPAPGHGGDPGRDATASWSTRNRSCASSTAWAASSCPAPTPASRPSARRSRTSSTQRQAEFIKGAEERGVSEETAEEIFDLIVHLRRATASTSRHTRRLRPARLPDRLPEGALPRRVHGRPALQRDRGRQQARHHGRAHRRRPPAGRRGAAARRQRRRAPTSPCTTARSSSA